MTDGVSEASDAASVLDDGDDLDERELEALNAAITRSLEQEARGEVAPMSEILARLRARRREQHGSSGQPSTERDRVVNKVERSLAGLDAGTGVPHPEVLAMIDERYPGSSE